MPIDSAWAVYGDHGVAEYWAYTTAFGTMPSAGWKFSHMDLWFESDDYFVKIYVARDSTQPCTPGSVVISHEVIMPLDSIRFPDSVHFWQSDSTYLDVDASTINIV